MESSLEQIQFLDEQQSCMSFIFDQIEITKGALRALKKNIHKHDYVGIPREHILTIESMIKKITIYVKDFNAGDFTTIKNLVERRDWYELLETSRRVK